MNRSRDERKTPVRTITDVSTGRALLAVGCVAGPLSSVMKRTLKDKVV
jgi:hypothetical protein